LADLLAYTACMFTNRYRGDIYAPTVYQALALTSQNKRIWNKHKGSITDIAFSDDKSGYMISCSTYGEIMKHTHFGTGNPTSEMLFSNPRFDFRDCFIDRATDITYALSRSGHMVIIDSKKKVQVLEVTISKLKEMDVAGSQFILFGEEGMALFDKDKCAIVQEKKDVLVVPVRSFLEHRGRARFDEVVIPWVGNVTRGEESVWLEAHFDEVADACRETGIYVGNLSWIAPFHEAGVPVYGDYGLNVFNSQAEAANVNFSQILQDGLKRYLGVQK
jgi:hypothetical protein